MKKILIIDSSNKYKNMKKRFNNDKTEVAFDLETAVEKNKNEKYDVITIHLGPLIDDPKNIKTKLLPIFNTKKQNTKIVLLSGGANYIASAKSQIGSEASYIGEHSEFNSNLDELKKEKNYKKRKKITIGDALYERLKEETNCTLISSEEISNMFYPFVILSILMQGYLSVKYIKGELTIDKENEGEKILKTEEEEIKKIVLRNKSNTKIDPNNEVDKWSWWTECIGLSDDPEKDKKYCLVHKTERQYVLDGKFYTKMEELNKNETVNKALRTKLYGIFGKHSSSNIKKLAELVIKNKKKIIGLKIDNNIEEIQIQNLIEIVKNTYLEYHEVAEVLNSLRPSNLL